MDPKTFAGGPPGRVLLVLHLVPALYKKMEIALRRAAIDRDAGVALFGHLRELCPLVLVLSWTGDARSLADDNSCAVLDQNGSAVNEHARVVAVRHGGIPMVFVIRTLCVPT